jgi:hypothetical protein
VQEDLLASLPNSTSNSPQHSQVIGALKQSLGALDRLIAERTALRGELTGLSQRDDITAQLLAASASGDFETVFNQELQKYVVIQEKLQQNFSNQAMLLDKIQVRFFFSFRELNGIFPALCFRKTTRSSSQ